MSRPKSKGAYVPLAAQYFMDDAVLEAGPDAELMFVRILAFLASVSTDGFITDRQLQIVGNGLRAVPRRVESLVNVGLIARVSGGFLVRSWLKWNRSADEVGKLLAKDRERKAQNSGANTENSARNPNGIQVDSELQSRAEQSSTEQEEPNGSSSSDADASDPDEFTPDVLHLCDLLAELARANGHTVGTVGVTWWRACERLMRLDGYNAQQIEWVMRWATSNEFWLSNIRSMPKLREKFSELKTRALAEKAKQQIPNRAQERQAGNLAVVGQLAALDNAEQRGIAR